MTPRVWLWLFLMFWLCAPAPALAGGPLTIVNDTPWDIINILATGKDQESFYWRLDLPPKGNDVVSSPATSLALRLDTGLALCTFADVPLEGARRIIFKTEPRIVIEYAAGNSASTPGRCEPLVPDHTPVCNLDRFHPAMPMKEVCAIVPGQLPRDDNGALLTGLSFAGLHWAARLVPVAGASVTEDSLLEHMELRRPLTMDTVRTLVRTLFSSGYMPWQAEFPGIDMEFPAKDPDKQEMDVLLSAMDGFIKAHQVRGHANHSLREKCDEASVILAPSALLPELQTADAPPEDMQIYTIILRPCTNTLLLDLAAYRAN